MLRRDTGKAAPDIPGSSPAGLSPNPEPEAGLRGADPEPKATLQGAHPEPEAMLQGAVPEPEARLQGADPEPEAGLRGGPCSSAFRPRLHGAQNFTRSLSKASRP